MSLKVCRMLEGRRVVLASASPRRKELLKLICSNFEICPPKCEEILTGDSRFSSASEELSYRKCMEVGEKYDGETLVIACDTTVVSEGEILGKPADREQAEKMLKSLSGRTHVVISGVTISLGGRTLSFSERTNVTFRKLSDETVRDYIDSGEPFDKAGGYGIQSLGALLVEKIEGDYFNVVGLPLSTLAEKLEQFLG